MARSNKQIAHKAEPLIDQELDAQIQKRIDELEDALNNFNKTPGLRDPLRRAHLASLFMAHLKEKQS